MKGYRRDTRPAFTLIEMLIVIALIAVLAALAVSGAMRVMEGQNESNTRTGIQTAYSILQKQWAKVVADAKKETIPADSAVRTLANNNELLAQVLWVKLRLMEAFPSSFNEIQNFAAYASYQGGFPLIPASVKRNISTYRRRLSQQAWPNVPVDRQSAACIVMALSVNRGGVVLDEEKLGPFLRDVGFGLSAGSSPPGVNMLVDGWGNPISFFRFPTEYPNLKKSNGVSTWLNPAKTGKADTYSDPLDPDGLLQSSTYDTSYFTDTLKAHTVAASVYIIPALVSSGPDGRLGLNLQDNYGLRSDMGVVNAADAGDNIYSFYLNVGGTGN